MPPQAPSDSRLKDQVDSRPPVPEHRAPGRPHPRPYRAAERHGEAARPPLAIGAGVSDLEPITTPSIPTTDSSRPSAQCRFGAAKVAMTSPEMALASRGDRDNS